MFFKIRTGLLAAALTIAALTATAAPAAAAVATPTAQAAPEAAEASTYGWCWRNFCPI